MAQKGWWVVLRSTAGNLDREFIPQWGNDRERAQRDILDIITEWSEHGGFDDGDTITIEEGESES